VEIRDQAPLMCRREKDSALDWIGVYTGASCRGVKPPSDFADYLMRPTATGGRVRA
jgi:hypothetical protein